MSPHSEEAASSSRWSLFLLGVILLVGSTYRLLWPHDMEYKADEQWTFIHYAVYRGGGELPMLGMPSSQGLRNPNMSIWVFLGLGTLGQAQNPVALVRMVQLLNVSAFGLLLVFVYRAIPKEERESWLWAIALFAVNPLDVVWHRKIWAQSILPAFSALFLIAWWYRRRPLGAACWGFVGALLGQIHMPGFFYAAGFSLWAALFDRRNVSWRGWFVGSVLGTLVMIPWLRYLLESDAGFIGGSNRWLNMLLAGYWFYWFVQSLGFGLHFTLGQDSWEFLQYPRILGWPSYGMAIVHLVLLGVGLYLLREAICWFRRRRPTWRDLFVGENATTFTQNAGLWGAGIVTWLSGFFVHPHYLVVIIVLRFLWIPRLLLGESTSRNRRWILLVLLVGQALLTFALLCYIHGKQNISGDYGRPYSAQTQ